MPKCDIQVLNGLPPKPSTKTKHWNQAMFELKRYGENIESMRDKMGGVKDKSLKMLMLKNKSSGQSSPQRNSLGQKKADSSQDGGLSRANHSPYPPPVVEVTPSDGADAMSLSDTEVSSPGTPPSLQIDLKESGSQDRTPSKGRAMPSGGRGEEGGQSLLGAISRNSQVPGTLDFSDSGPQSVVVRSPSSNSSSKMIKRKGMKAGAALSALVSSLQRKRVAEHVSSLTPVHQGAALGMPGPGGQEEAESSKSKAAATAEETTQDTSSPFSSIYVQTCKTAFAIVDPEQKRAKRKTAKAGGETLTPPPSKKVRMTNNTAAAAMAAAEAAASNSKSDGESIGDPAAFAAKVQEFSHAAITALNTATTAATAPPSSSSSNHPVTVSSLKPGAANSVRASVSASPNSSGSASNSSGSGAATLGLPGLPKVRTTGGGKKKGGKRPADKNRRGKLPHTKGAAKAAAANASNSPQPAAAPVSTATSSLAALISAPAGTATPSTSTTETAATTRANFMSQVTQASIVSTPQVAVEAVRGEAAAPGIVGDEISDFAEGTGLLADTIRKVDASLQARVNQITGHTDDMGYKYFVEKVS